MNTDGVNESLCVLFRWETKYILKMKKAVFA